MEILEHGIYYNECNEITCSCGCKFRYEIQDICTDNTLILTSNPPQYNRYVRCPECGARIYLNTVKQSVTIPMVGYGIDINETFNNLKRTTTNSGKTIYYKAVNGTEEK